MKKFFRILTVASMAFQAYNYFMENKRDKKLREMENQIQNNQ